MASPFGKSKLENRTGKRVQLSKVGAKGEAANKKPYSLRLLYLNTDPSSRSFQSELLDAWRPKGIHRPKPKPCLLRIFPPYLGSPGLVPNLWRRRTLGIALKAANPETSRTSVPGSGTCTGGW